MEDKKTQYEKKIAEILRRVMEVSYLRKRNTERMVEVLKKTRASNTPQTSAPLEVLLQEYNLLKDQVSNHLGINKTDNGMG